MWTVRDLQEIRDEVGRVFDYTTDKEGRGVSEHWVDQDELAGLDPAERKSFKDDCDGSALLCRYKCRQRGIPSRLVMCRVTKGDPTTGHLVLEVDGYILDNRHQWVMSRNFLDYEWIKMSGFERDDPWHRIENGKAV